MARTQFERRAGTFLFLFATTLAACASYDGSYRKSNPPTLGDEDGGSTSGGLPATAGVGGSPAAGASGAPVAGAAGAAGAALGGAGAGGSPSGGGAGVAGTDAGGVSGMAGLGGAAMGGSIAGGDSAGSGGGVVTDQLLSLGKPASADSEETGSSHLAADGNDGSATTRWCANDGAAGHSWKVDLGQTYTLTKLAISWEKAAIYKFKVETSLDGNAFSLVVDQTQSTNDQANQIYVLADGVNGRWVRVTTTALPATNVWASFFEFQVYGH